MMLWTFLGRESKCLQRSRNKVYRTSKLYFDILQTISPECSRLLSSSKTLKHFCCQIFTQFWVRNMKSFKSFWAWKIVIFPYKFFLITFKYFQSSTFIVIFISATINILSNVHPFSGCSLDWNDGVDCASGLFKSRIVSCSQNNCWGYCQWYEFVGFILNGY